MKEKVRSTSKDSLNFTNSIISREKWRKEFKKKRITSKVDCLDAIIQEVYEYTKKNKEKLITVNSYRNIDWINKRQIEKQQPKSKKKKQNEKKNNCTDTSCNNLKKMYMRWLRLDYEV